jgi:C-terminal processing protease CtpA/Prc
VRTPEDTPFDGQGIPPDIAVPVFAADDVVAKRDPGMTKAVEILLKRQMLTPMPNTLLR